MAENIGQPPSQITHGLSLAHSLVFVDVLSHK